MWRRGGIKLVFLRSGWKKKTLGHDLLYYSSLSSGVENFSYMIVDEDKNNTDVQTDPNMCILLCPIRGFKLGH